MSMIAWMIESTLGLFLLILLLIVVPILGSIIWIWMLIDCAKRDFKESNDKVVWVIIIVLLHVIGALIYYFVVKKKDRR